MRVIVLRLAHRPVFVARRIARQPFEPALLGNQAKNTELQRKTLLDHRRAGRFTGLVVDDREAAVFQSVDPVGAPVNLYAFEGHPAFLFDCKHAAPLVALDLVLDPAQSGFEPRLPQPAHQRVGILLLEHGLHDRPKRRAIILLARPMPALEDGMRDIALPQHRRLGIERVEIGQAHNLARIELVRIAQQPVERGGGNVDVTLFGRGIGRRARIAFGHGGAGHGAGEIDRLFFLISFQHFSEQRLNAQQETRRDGRPGLVALGTGKHDLGRPHGSGEIVRGQADAEIGTGHAQRAQDRRCEQRIDPAARGPDALVQSGADHQLGPIHPAFEEAEDLHARMAAIGWPHRDLFHRVAQGNGGISGCEGKIRLARMEAKILYECGDRAAIFLGPQLLAA